MRGWRLFRQHQGGCHQEGSLGHRVPQLTVRGGALALHQAAPGSPVVCEEGVRSEGWSSSLSVATQVCAVAFGNGGLGSLWLFSRTLPAA